MSDEKRGEWGYESKDRLADDFAQAASAGSANEDAARGWKPPPAWPVGQPETQAATNTADVVHAFKLSSHALFEHFEGRCAAAQRLIEEQGAELVNMARDRDDAQVRLGKSHEQIEQLETLLRIGDDGLRDGLVRDVDEVRGYLASLANDGQGIAITLNPGGLASEVRARFVEREDKHQRRARARALELDGLQQKMEAERGLCRSLVHELDELRRQQVDELRRSRALEVAKLNEQLQASRTTAERMLSWRSDDQAVMREQREQNEELQKTIDKQREQIDGWKVDGANDYAAKLRESDKAIAYLTEQVTTAVRDEQEVRRERDDARQLLALERNASFDWNKRRDDYEATIKQQGEELAEAKRLHGLTMDSVLDGNAKRRGLEMDLASVREQLRTRDEELAEAMTRIKRQSEEFSGYLPTIERFFTLVDETVGLQPVQSFEATFDVLADFLNRQHAERDELLKKQRAITDLFTRANDVLFSSAAKVPPFEIRAVGLKGDASK